MKGTDGKNILEEDQQPYFNRKDVVSSFSDSQISNLGTDAIK